MKKRLPLYSKFNKAAAHERKRKALKVARELYFYNALPLRRKDLIELLLPQHPTMLSWRDEQGRTALKILTFEGSWDYAAWLIEKGADVNACDKHGFSLLNLFTMRDDVVGVKWLLEHGAKADGVTPSSGTSTLMHAVRRDTRECFDALLPHVQKLDAQNAIGWTALHLASFMGTRDIALDLARHGATLAIVDREGRTPARIAHDYGHIELSQELNALMINKNVNEFCAGIPASLNASSRLILRKK